MTDRGCEVSRFSALCDDDFLGVPDPMPKSSLEHCRDIVLQADAQGFDDILLPSGYTLGIDTTAFAAAIATMVKRIRWLMAGRIGESWPPQRARQIATIDQIQPCASRSSTASRKTSSRSRSGPAPSLGLCLRISG
ncbi:hypothetical protein HDC35_000389 [Sphingopyxis sp. JAI128]|nr:hypothetical protein [Sphingopyxis sp. JAI128]